MKLENQSAIVTGGAKGIGRAVCELFAAEGARVAILDLDAEQGEAAAAGLRSGGHDAAFFRCDVGDAAQARQALDAAAAVSERPTFWSTTRHGSSTSRCWRRRTRSSTGC